MKIGPPVNIGKTLTLLPRTNCLTELVDKKIRIQNLNLEETS